VRLTVLCLALLLACNDLEYLTGTGEPVPLTPQSLEGSWVRIRVVVSTVAAPVLGDTTEIPETFPHDLDEDAVTEDAPAT
jgi:hypothetical protein